MTKRQTLEQYVVALNEFCGDLSESILRYEEAGNLEAIEQIQDAIRHTLANLTLADYECGRILSRA